MKILEYEPEQIPFLLNQYIKDKKNVFVFPTDVAASSWADWCVMHPMQSGVKAVALENFLTWDKFKENFMQDKGGQKTAIPALLRKLFVTSILRRNEEQPFLKKIIAPQFAADSTAFSDWLNRILPSLKQWHVRYSQYLVQNNVARDEDAENQDYLFLYNSYNTFLEENNLFEPAWTASKLKNQNYNFILLYPEILEDYADYTDSFLRSESVTVIRMPETEKLTPFVYRFPDSRTEMRRICLYIRKLVEQKKADWTEIALNVPDLKTFRPYLERELENYCIPFVVRAGVDLACNCAGSIFSEIYDCYSEDFSFDSVRTLLLNEYVPWKKTGHVQDGEKLSSNFEALRENLIREGSRLRCICSYEESENSGKIDVWQKALRAVPQDELELRFYEQLKKDIKTICEASSFENVRTAWFVFKQHFLEESKFSAEADMLLSRCIACLNEMIQIEKDFILPKNIVIESPFRFFLNEIKQKTYTPQSSKTGISVFPYRLSACAYFKYQFVIDSSQKNLNTVYRTLDFLSNEKRAALKLTDENENVSNYFIRLYAKNTPEGFVPFSYSEENFAGYAIPHNFLRLYSNSSDSNGSEQFPLQNLDKDDFILGEKDWFLEGCGEKPMYFTQAQKDCFLTWCRRNEKASVVSNPKELNKKISYVVIEKRNPDVKDGAKMKITQSDLKNFFPCGRKWIFSNVLRLQDDSLETSLLSYTDMGKITHKVLECFMRDYTGKKLPCLLNGERFADEERIKTELENYVTKTITEDPEMDFYCRPLSMLSLRSQIQTITTLLQDCLREICAQFGGFQIACTEKWLECDDPSGKWAYAGKLDCVMTGDDGRAAIIDYKSGEKVPNVKDCSITTDGELKDFQIPAYIVLWNGTNEKKVSTALFFSILDKKCKFIVNESKKTVEAYSDTLDAFRNYSREFYEKVSSDTIEPVKLSQKDLYETCSDCNFKAICRKTFSVAGEKHD